MFVFFLFNSDKDFLEYTNSGQVNSLSYYLWGASQNLPLGNWIRELIFEVVNLNLFPLSFISEQALLLAKKKEWKIEAMNLVYCFNIHCDTGWFKIRIPNHKVLGQILIKSIQNSFIDRQFWNISCAEIVIKVYIWKLYKLVLKM